MRLPTGAAHAIGLSDFSSEGREMSSLSRAARGVSEVLFLIALAAAPVPFGSVEDFWISIWILMLSASILIYPVISANIDRRPLVVVFLIAVVLLFLLLAQTRWPALPGQMDPVLAEAGRLLDRSFPDRVSSSASTPWHALGPNLLFLLAFTRAYLMARDDQQATRVLLFIAFYAGLLAIYGIVAFTIAPEQLLGRQKTAYLGNLTATFVNRNTAAAFFATGSVIFLGLCIAELRARFGDLQRGFLKHVSLLGLSRRATLCLLGFGLCFVALGMTGSRAGVLLAMGAFLFLMLNFLYKKGKNFARLTLIITLLALVMTLAFDLWGGLASERLERLGLIDQARLETYRIGLAMLADRPWFGFGHGSFEAVFPAYRSAELGSFGVWDRAHNTLLEIAIELGAPAAIGFLLIWMAGLTALARAAFSSEGWGSSRTVVVIALAIAGMAGLHSLVDFPLQIPGYSVPFAAIAGVGLARALDNTSARTKTHKQERF